MDYLKLPERDLLKACLEGNKAAWDSFIQRYTDLIYHTIYRILKISNFKVQEGIVADLYQEVILSLFKDNYRKLRLFKGRNGCSLVSWLRMVINSLVIDFIRKQKELISLDEETAEKKSLKDTIINGKNNPIATIEKSEEYRLIKECISSLSSKEKLIFELCYFRELPDEEVAQILKISISALYMRKSRIKEKLRIIAKKKKIL